ncbi:MAG: hypothetical protein OEY35_00390 [Gammaproteobacteria bacterium]|nr:hypothetical protein [Gammaproteobacteria bacterium]
MEINTTSSSTNASNQAASKRETQDALNTANDQPNTTVGPEDNELRSTESVQASNKAEQDTANENRVQEDKRQGRVVDITV